MKMKMKRSVCMEFIEWTKNDPEGFPHHFKNFSPFPCFSKKSHVIQVPITILLIEISCFARRLSHFHFSNELRACQLEN